jgi:hypothetical protein
MRLSELTGCAVEDERGKRLGRVRHVSAERRARTGTGAELVVTKLHVGRGRFLERLGFRRHRSGWIAWEEVVRLEPGRIVVKANGAEG